MKTVEEIPVAHVLLWCVSFEFKLPNANTSICSCRSDASKSRYVRPELIFGIAQVKVDMLAAIVFLGKCSSLVREKQRSARKSIW